MTTVREAMEPELSVSSNDYLIFTPPATDEISIPSLADFKRLEEKVDRIITMLSAYEKTTPAVYKDPIEYHKMLLGKLK